MVEWVEFVPKTFAELPERFQYYAAGEWIDDTPDDFWCRIFSRAGHATHAFRKQVSTTQETEPMTELVKIKMWRAVRVTTQKVPHTLADCEEGRLAIFDTSRFGLVIRKRVGTKRLTSNDEESYPDAGTSKFVRYLDDPPPVVPVPKTFGELRDGQCFTVSDDKRIRWRCGNDFMVLASGGHIFSYGVEHDTPITFIPDIKMVLEEKPC